MQLFQLGVPGQANDLHAVLQRSRDGIKGVGRGDEEHLGEIVVHVQIVVIKGHILFRVQHLQEGGGRVAPEIGGHLVHLVEQKTGFMDPARRMDCTILPGIAPI